MHEIAEQVGLLMLRLFVGSFTVLAGIQICVSDADFAEIVRGLGVPFPSAAALLVVLGHLVLGVLLALGLFTRAVGVLLAVKYYLIFFTYYIQQFGESTLRLIPPGTLWGVESLTYGTVGVLFACTGPGHFSLDALLRPLWTRAGKGASWLGPYLFADASVRPAGGHLDVAALGQVMFRVFIGGLLILHSVYQIRGVSLNPGTETMTKLSSKLDTLGLPVPTLIAWITTLTMLVVGAMLIPGLFVRAGGLLLAPAPGSCFSRYPD
jgi:putative oxidoreductase